MSDAVKMTQLDILSVKIYWKNYLLLLLYPLIFSWWSPSSLAIVCSLMFSVMAISVFSVQEKNHLERLYSLFCLRKRSIVLGRYLFSALHLLLALGCALPLSLIITTVTGRGVESGEMIFCIGIAFSMFWLITGIQLPLVFHMGYTRSRLWVYLPFVLIALIPVLGQLFPASVNIMNAILGLLKTAEHNPWPTFAGCIAVGLVCAAISFFASLAIYTKESR